MSRILLLQPKCDAAKNEANKTSAEDKVIKKEK